jgi:hypothetical protein
MLDIVADSPLVDYAIISLFSLFWKEKEAYEIILLSVHPSVSIHFCVYLPLLLRLQIILLPDCLCVPSPNFLGLWDHLAVCVRLLTFSFSMRSVSYQGGLWNHLAVCASVFPSYLIVFYAVRVVSKESRRLSRSTTSCFHSLFTTALLFWCGLT